MSDKSVDGEPVGDFSDVTPEEFLDKTADNTASEPAADERIGETVSPTDELTRLVSERTDDLQRLQAEYANYKKRVDRDRLVSHSQGVEAVVRDLIPVLDAIEQADAHGELTGGFKLVADELFKLADKHGLVLYGAPDEEFDPRKHEALMQVPVPGTGEMLVHEVMQKGAQIGENVVRPARVVVAVPNGETTPNGEATSAEEADSAA